jgi:hypothetical protein
MTSDIKHPSTTRKSLNLCGVPSVALLCLLTMLMVNAQQPVTPDAGKQDAGKQDAGKQDAGK